MLNFKGFIFKLFPHWFKQEDTNKDINGKGTFERYLSIFEDDLEEDIRPFITNFMDIFDTINVDARYLPYISFYLGEPPSANGDINIYRKILAYAVQIYKVKGTKKSYELLFNLYGLDVDIVEDMPKKAANYDNDQVLYDDGWNYDQTCEYCSCYYIVYKPTTQADNTLNVNLQVPADIMELIHKIVCFIQPINAKLCGIYQKLTFADELVMDLEDDANVELTDRIRYVNFLAPLNIIPGPIAAQIISAYDQGPTNWDDDLDQIFSELEDDGPANAIIFYDVLPDGGAQVYNWIYGVPMESREAFENFLRSWFTNNHLNATLELSGDFLYPNDPEGPLYFASALNPIPLESVAKVLIGFDTLLPLTGCPDPQYPLGIYGVDDHAIGVAADAADVARIWNSYGPNKIYGYLEHDSGCTFKLWRRPDESDIMTDDIKAQFITSGPTGDFNEDFMIDPGGDFY